MTSLDLFILTLLKYGINTPYTMAAQAGVSLGASLPAIRRLVAERLIKETPRGPRGRREFQLTKSGEKAMDRLDQVLDAALLQPPRDIESILRFSACAIGSGRTEKAIELLDKAAQEYSGRSAAALSQAGERAIASHPGSL